MVSLSREGTKSWLDSRFLREQRMKLYHTLPKLDQLYPKAQSGGPKVTTPSDQYDRVSDRKSNLRYRTRYRIC